MSPPTKPFGSAHSRAGPYRRRSSSPMPALVPRATAIHGDQRARFAGGQLGVERGARALATPRARSSPAFSPTARPRRAFTTSPATSPSGAGRPMVRSSRCAEARSETTRQPRFERGPTEQTSRTPARTTSVSVVSMQQVRLDTSVLGPAGRPAHNRRPAGSLHRPTCPSPSSASAPSSRAVKS